VAVWQSGSGSVARGVAVAGWQWWQLIAEVRAVRMVLNRVWQWQYWLRYDQYLQYAQKSVKNSCKMPKKTPIYLNLPKIYLKNTKKTPKKRIETHNKPQKTPQNPPQKKHLYTSNLPKYT
jgi:hypothetical protein